jgi:hypothetical protein
MGSTTEALLRACDIPVLVFHAPDTVEPAAEPVLSPPKPSLR